jgi:hypothetical protein
VNQTTQRQTNQYFQVQQPLSALQVRENKRRKATLFAFRALLATRSMRINDALGELTRRCGEDTELLAGATDVLCHLTLA